MVSVEELEERTVSFLDGVKDLSTVTVKSVLEHLLKEINEDIDFFHTHSDLKNKVKEFILLYISKKNDSDQENSSKLMQLESAQIKSSSKKRLKSSKTTKEKTDQKKVDRPKKRVKTKTIDMPSSTLGKDSNHNLKRLNKFARAMGSSPTIFVDLPEDVGERVKELSKRLKSCGGTFQGLVPSDKEINKALKVQEKKKDLEGMKMENIISSEKRPLRERKRINYALIDGNIDEDEESEKSDENTETSPSKGALNSSEEEEP